MTLVASAPTSRMAIAVVDEPQPANLLSEPAAVERPGEPVHHFEDRHEGPHADNQRDDDEEAGDEAAPRPLHKTSARAAHDAMSQKKTAAASTSR